MTRKLLIPTTAAIGLSLASGGCGGEESLSDLTRQFCEKLSSCEGDDYVDECVSYYEDTFELNEQVNNERCAELYQAFFRCYFEAYLDDARCDPDSDDAYYACGEELDAFWSGECYVYHYND